MATTAAPEVTCLEDFFHEDIPARAAQLCDLCRHIKEELVAGHCPLLTPAPTATRSLQTTLRLSIDAAADNIGYLVLSHFQIEVAQHCFRPRLPRITMADHLRVSYNPCRRLPQNNNNVHTMRQALFAEFHNIFQHSLRLPSAAAQTISLLSESLWLSFYLELCYLFELYLARHFNEGDRLQPLVKLLPHVIPLGTFRLRSQQIWLIPCP